MDILTQELLKISRSLKAQFPQLGRQEIAMAQRAIQDFKSGLDKLNAIGKEKFGMEMEQAETVIRNVEAKIR